MTGRTCIVTGANTGIGLETARQLAVLGARVVLACRSEAKGQAALADIKETTGSDLLEFHQLDLSSLAAVRESAETLLARDMPIHVLVNNAGLAGARGLTEDGWEAAFGVNHLGHFLWTLLLLPRLKKSAPARVVTVASHGHTRVERIDYDVLRSGAAGKTAFHEYCISKLANVLFSAELGRRLEGSGVTSYSLHPGGVASDIWRRVPQPFRWLMTRFMITNEEGARTSTYCACDPTLDGITGRYYKASAEAPAAPRVGDEEAAKRLWEFSEEAVGLRLDGGFRL